MFDPKQAGEEADQMIAKLNQPDNAVEDQAGDDAAAIVQDVNPTSDDDQGAEPVAAEPVQDDTSKKLETLAKQAEVAEQRWKVLQGMIDKKDSEIETLRALLAQLNQAAAKPDTQAPAKEYVTSKDTEAFGEDMIDLNTRVAQSVFQAEAAKLREYIDGRFAKLEGSVQGVEKVTAKTAQDLFFDALAQRVPDWETINVDQGYLTWLNEVDPFTGATRMELLQHAVSRQDVHRAANFFNEYKRVAGLDQPQEEPPSKAKVQKLVAPGRGKASAPRVDSGSKRTWSRAEIARLYDDKMAGKISQKEFDELERDIFAAQHDGRIAA